MRARVEPREAASEGLDFQLAVLQKDLVYSRDFQFAPGRRFDLFSHIDHFVGIEVESHYGIVGFGIGRLFLDRKAVAVSVEFRHAVTLRIIDPVAEYGGLVLLFGRADRSPEHRRETRAVEDVVAQNQTGGIAADELLADQERLGQSVGRRLFGIFEPYTVIRSVAQQTPESRKVGRRGDDENIAYSGQHQDGDGVVNHRFVVDREQLFANTLGDRV